MTIREAVFQAAKEMGVSSRAMGKLMTPDLDNPLGEAEACAQLDDKDVDRFKELWKEMLLTGNYPKEMYDLVEETLKSNRHHN